MHILCLFFSTLFILMTLLDNIFLHKNIHPHIWKKYTLLFHTLIIFNMGLYYTEIIYPEMLPKLKYMMLSASFALCLIINSLVVLTGEYLIFSFTLKKIYLWVLFAILSAIAIFISPILSLWCTAIYLYLLSRKLTIPALKLFLETLTQVSLITSIGFITFLSNTPSTLGIFLHILILYSISYLSLLLLRPHCLTYHAHLRFQKKFIHTCMIFTSTLACVIYAYMKHIHVATTDTLLFLIIFCILNGVLGISIIFLKLWHVLTHAYMTASIKNFKKRILEIRPYLENIQDMQEYYSFLHSLLIETFSVKSCSIILFDPSFDSFVRVIQKGSDTSYSNSFVANELKKTIPHTEAFTINEKSQIIFMKYQIFDTHFIRMNLASPFMCYIAFSPQKTTDLNHLAQIRRQLDSLAESMDYILNIEKHKHALTKALKEERHEEKIQVLSREKSHLQAIIQNIRNMQTVILEKEKQVAITETAIRIDDEISNPLNNILVLLQYHIEKLEKGQPVDISKIIHLFTTIESQSFRIKDLLAQLNTYSSTRNFSNKLN